MWEFTRYVFPVDNESCCFISWEENQAVQNKYYLVSQYHILRIGLRMIFEILYCLFLTASVFDVPVYKTFTCFNDVWISGYHYEHDAFDQVFKSAIVQMDVRARVSCDVSPLASPHPIAAVPFSSDETVSANAAYGFEGEQPGIVLAVYLTADNFDACSWRRKTGKQVCPNSFYFRLPQQSGLLHIPYHPLCQSVTDFVISAFCHSHCLLS